MTTTTEIFTRYAPEYLEKYPNLPDSHRKVIEAILHRRTEEYGSNIYQCQNCKQLHTVNRSCGNRHCLQCQNHKTRQWLYNQLTKQ